MSSGHRVTLASGLASAVLGLAIFVSQAVADGLCRDATYVEQDVITIVRGPLTAQQETEVTAELAKATKFIWDHSNGSLKVNFKVVRMPAALARVEYKEYSFPDGSKRWAAMFSAAVQGELQKQKLDPTKSAGVVMVYLPDRNAPTNLFNNTWKYLDDAKETQPGFTSVPIGQARLGEVVVHEYLHQLDHRFEEVGHPDTAQRGFLNPDHKTHASGTRLATLLKTSFASDPVFYQYVLKYYVDASNALRPVNYRWLAGKRGTVRGNQPRTSYDFAQSGVSLVHVQGDNLTSRRPGPPASFWFRAQAGRTAAFGTETAYGRYLLKKVAFNYEIAPGDRTFQVWLFSCDSSGAAKKERIDDGGYTLGRQQLRANRKSIVVNKEAEDFRIVFQKGNQLTGPAAADDWVLIGNIDLDLALAP